LISLSYRTGIHPEIECRERERDGTLSPHPF